MPSLSRSEERPIDFKYLVLEKTTDKWNNHLCHNCKQFYQNRYNNLCFVCDQHIQSHIDRKGFYDSELVDHFLVNKEKELTILILRCLLNQKQMFDYFNYVVHLSVTPIQEKVEIIKKNSIEKGHPIDLFLAYLIYHSWQVSFCEIKDIYKFFKLEKWFPKIIETWNAESTIEVEPLKYLVLDWLKSKRLLEQIEPKPIVKKQKINLQWFEQIKSKYVEPSFQNNPYGPPEYEDGLEMKKLVCRSCNVRYSYADDLCLTCAAKENKFLGKSSFEQLIKNQNKIETISFRECKENNDLSMEALITILLDQEKMMDMVSFLGFNGSEKMMIDKVWVEMMLAAGFYIKPKPYQLCYWFEFKRTKEVIEVWSQCRVKPKYFNFYQTLKHHIDLWLSYRGLITTKSTIYAPPFQYQEELDELEKETVSIKVLNEELISLLKEFNLKQKF